jgi:hypothetical protein
MAGKGHGSGKQPIKHSRTSVRIEGWSEDRLTYENNVAQKNDGRADLWEPNMLRHITALATQELIVQMTHHDIRSEERDQRTFADLDPCVGSGRMLLHLSNVSMNLFGQDIEPLAVAMCKINGALYAPWISYPLPARILESKSAQHVVAKRFEVPASDGEWLFRVDDRQQRLLFEP